MHTPKTAVILVDSVTGNTQLIANNAQQVFEQHGIATKMISLKELDVPLAKSYRSEIFQKPGEADEAYEERSAAMIAEAQAAVRNEIEGADYIICATWNRRSAWSYAFALVLPAFAQKKISIMMTSGSVMEPYQTRCREKLVDMLDETTEVAGIFVCQGKMRPSVREKYMRLHNQMSDSPEKIAMRIANFDEALNHPNEADFAAARAFISELIANE